MLVMISIGCAILVLQRIIDVIQGSTYMIYFAIIYAILPWIFYKFSKILNTRNADRKDLKETGTKVKGEIVDIKKLKYYRSSRISQTLVVVFDNKSTMIYDILENDAFSILKMLLDEYPFETVNTVPVDVYTYKNKVYVDLESVDLSKVDGYEEAVKMLEDIKDDMTM
ncbi:MAG: hypothetical protein IJW20_07050 [Clostridia bacterium]|nr:hypothetical protein [Clostridia bacterium]